MASTEQHGGKRKKRADISPELQAKIDAVWASGKFFRPCPLCIRSGGCYTCHAGVCTYCNGSGFMDVHKKADGELILGMVFDSKKEMHAYGAYICNECDIRTCKLGACTRKRFCVRATHKTEWWKKPLKREVHCMHEGDDYYMCRACRVKQKNHDDNWAGN